MREILFRGRRVDNDEWVYGYLVNAHWYLNDRPVTVIIPDDAIIYPHGEISSHEIVRPETVGQFTGLIDVNGSKIFEGDIIRTRKNGVRIEKLKGFLGYDSDGYPKKVPGFEGTSDYCYPCTLDCFAVVKFNPRNGFYLDGTDMFVDAICNEVVGNIYENPELLQKERSKNV